jgi:carboxypeptidase C (cathepsin A)
MIEFGFTHGLYGVDLKEKYDEYCVNNLDNHQCDIVSGEINGLISKVNVYSIYDQCFSPESKMFSKKGKFRYTPWIFGKNKPKNVSTNQVLKFLELSKSEAPPCVDDVGFNTYYNREDVKKALNVRTEIEFELCSDKVGKHYTMDFVKGSYYLYPKLIKSGIRIFKFSGDTDAVVPFNGTQKWIRNLDLPILDKWRTWHLGDPKNIAGYVTKYDGLTFVTVRGAGHMVPSSRSKEAFYLFTRFLNGKDL